MSIELCNSACHTFRLHEKTMVSYSDEMAEDSLGGRFGTIASIPKIDPYSKLSIIKLLLDIPDAFPATSYSFLSSTDPFFNI